MQATPTQFRQRFDDIEEDDNDDDDFFLVQIGDTILILTCTLGTNLVWLWEDETPLPLI